MLSPISERTAVSIARHCILFVYAVSIVLLALVMPLGVAVFGNSILASFKCIDQGPHLVCATSWLSDLGNLLSTLMIIMWGLSLLTLWIAGFAALLLLISLLFRLCILLTAHFIIHVGR
jgi:hypothetical protein